jgi:hypothetical protein
MSANRHILIAVATRKPIIAAGLPFYSTFTLVLSGQSGDLLARISRHFYEKTPYRAFILLGTGLIREFHQYLLSELVTLCLIPQYTKGYGLVAL